LETVRVLPKISGGMSIEIKGQPPIHYTYAGEVPKEVMDVYEQIVGNSLAKVSVSADMGIKDFGTGASSMVSISLTCNQDSKTIEKAVELAGTSSRVCPRESTKSRE
jgi:hypothetical protein